MRIVIVGATGNVGTSVLEALAADDAVDSILGLARRCATARYAKTAFVAADVTRDDLVPHFRGADCVIHLAWLIQPSRDRQALRATNVDGSARVLDAVAAAGVPAIVAASSIGVYSPGPKSRVDETWPRAGIPTSWYSRHKAELERMLDRFEAEHDVRVVRLRPALIMKRESSEEVRRLFTGPLLPSPLLRPGRLPVSRRDTSSSSRSSSRPCATASNSPAQNSTRRPPSLQRSSVSRRPASPESRRRMISSMRVQAVS